MFSTAKTIAPKATAAKKVTKAQHEISGISDLALLHALIASATAMAKSIETKGGTRPSSFEGLDGVATCSVEMRKRGTNSALSDDEVKTLRKAGIEPFSQVITQELFAINPKYAENSELLGKVEKALGKIVPEDFIVKQEGVSKFVVSDEMLDTAFKQADTDAVLSIMTTMALKPKLSEAYDMANLITDTMKVMQPKKKEVSLPKAKKAA
jgi:hypothetical protein